MYRGAAVIFLRAHLFEMIEQKQLRLDAVGGAVVPGVKVGELAQAVLPRR